MITVLNRKELLVTFSMDEQARARDILSANGIDYQVKTVNPSARSYIGSSSRGRSGSFGINHDAAYQYYIYVHSKDYERAKHLI